RPPGMLTICDIICASCGGMLASAFPADCVLVVTAISGDDVAKTSVVAVAIVKSPIGVSVGTTTLTSPISPGVALGSDVAVIICTITSSVISGSGVAVTTSTMRTSAVTTWVTTSGSP